MHKALAEFFQHGADPVAQFEAAWETLEDAPLRFSRKDSWKGFLRQGQALLSQFFEKDAGKVTKVLGVEKVFQIGVSDLSLPFIGVIDLVAEVSGKRTVVDFKTSQSKYPAHEVQLADQLTAYKLGEPAAEQVALCVFVKTKKPQIEWYFAKRTDQQLIAFLSKATFVADQIAESNFYLRPGKWCAQCDYLPVCTGNKPRARESLVQIQPQQR